MKHAFERERRIAIEAVCEAARLCKAVQAEITREALEKKDKSPVTVADFGSQALICRMIREAFAGDPIIAEEDSAELRSVENAGLAERVLNHVRRLRPAANAPAAWDWIDYGSAADFSDRFWTLDPIDGTKGFLRGEQYAIALAVVVEGRIEVAALACPNLSSLADKPDADGGAVFVAVRGSGAELLSIDGRAMSPIRVSTVSDPAQSRLCESVESAHSKHDAAAAVAKRLGIALSPRRLDSQAKYAVVARGEAEMYLRLPTSAEYREKIWDHAAGALVITEAGGRVTDIAGRALEFTHGCELSNNRGIVATNGLLHDRVLAVLDEIGVGPE